MTFYVHEQENYNKSKLIFKRSLFTESVIVIKCQEGKRVQYIEEKEKENFYCSSKALKNLKQKSSTDNQIPGVWNEKTSPKKDRPTSA